LAAIYASLYWMPPLVNFLRDRNLLRLTVGLAFVAAAAAVAIRVRRRRPGWREALTVGAFVPLYAVLLARMERAEEAFHFLEYGAVAALAYGALEERRRAALETVDLRRAAPAAARPGAAPSAKGASDSPAAAAPPSDSPAGRLRPLAPALAAVLATTAAGWLDEGIQAVLPNRYYDHRDVVFNGAAAAAAVAALAARGWARRRDRAAGGCVAEPR
jgi:hypothetical protein